MGEIGRRPRDEDGDFVPDGVPDEEKHFHTQGQDYPYGGAATDTLDHSDSKFKPHKAPKPDPVSGKPFGSTSVFPKKRNGKAGAPVTTRSSINSGCDKNGDPFAIESKGDVYLKVTAYDECYGSDCIKEWDVHWDVIFCPDCDTIDVVTPNITEL